jgi:2'-hydroxyisoflavone reductase
MRDNTGEITQRGGAPRLRRMEILVVGGTRFVGRHVVSAALERGHRVTLLHRGTAAGDPFPNARHLHADRDGDLGDLASAGPWDATVDVCAYLPRQVEHLAAALGGRGGQHLYVSTVSVYAPPDGPGLTEDGPLLPPAPPDVDTVTNDTYGPLKVACELAARAAYGDDLLVVRPTYVVGPDDYTWRFPWWVWRIGQGGEVLCPGPPDAPAQVIDVRDQATFVVDLLEKGAGGTYHTVSPAPPFSFGDLLESVAREVAPAGTTLTWVDEDRLLGAGLPEPALPLWHWGEPEIWTSAADPSRAEAAGLSVRPLAETVRDTRAWVDEAGPPPDRVGLAPDRERELLAGR